MAANTAPAGSAGPDAPGRAPRPLRADAQRNVGALLEAAKAVFGASGVDAPAKEIADLAGVGVGTLYRHFPQRSDLVKAVLEREIDACADAAPALAAAHEPGEALAAWLHRYTEFIATKRGLAAALHSGDPAFDALPGYFMQRTQPALASLLDAATATGEIRAGISARDLLHAVALLCRPVPGEDPAYSQRMVALLIDGLRYGTARQQLYVSICPMHAIEVVPGCTSLLKSRYAASLGPYFRPSPTGSPTAGPAVRRHQVRFAACDPGLPGSSCGYRVLSPPSTPNRRLAHVVGRPRAASRP